MGHIGVEAKFLIVELLLIDAFAALHLERVAHYEPTPVLLCHQIYCQYNQKDIKQLGIPGEPYGWNHSDKDRSGARLFPSSVAQACPYQKAVVANRNITQHGFRNRSG